jgi:hypothetical protein
VFAGGATLTVNAAGARLNAPPVVFEACVALIVADPDPTGVTVKIFVSPQLPNVTEDGLTVATEGSLDASERTSVVLPVRLQPFFPSPFCGAT